jgi:hypothetical protein
MVDFIPINRRKMNTNQPTNQPDPVSTALAIGLTLGQLVPLLM